MTSGDEVPHDHDPDAVERARQRRFANDATVLEAEMETAAPVTCPPWCAVDHAELFVSEDFGVEHEYWAAASGEIVVAVTVFQDAKGYCAATLYMEGPVLSSSIQPERADALSALLIEGAAKLRQLRADWQVPA